MKKVTKAALAAAAAGALLLGGAGTFALWNDTVDVNAGTVTTGHLLLTTDADSGTWVDSSPGATDTVFEPATDFLVPGDVVTFTQTVTVDASGKNLKGTFNVGTVGAVPAALTDQVAVDIAVTPTPGIVDTDGVLSFSEGSVEVPVTIRVTFEAGDLDTALTPPTTMDQPIVLGNLTLTLDQVR